MGIPGRNVRMMRSSFLFRETETGAIALTPQGLGFRLWGLGFLPALFGVGFRVNNKRPVGSLNPKP